MQCAEAARLPETGEQTGAVITSEMIRSYLETLSRRGRSRNTVQMYGAKLRAFYHYLPSDKRVPGCSGREGQVQPPVPAEVISGHPVGDRAERAAPGGASL